MFLKTEKKIKSNVFKKSPMGIWVSVGLCFVLWALFGFNFYSALGFSIAIYYLLLFIQNLGRNVPIRNFIVVIAALQWLAGPALAYEGLSNHYKYFMYVPADEYMPFAIGGIIALFLGLSVFQNKLEYQYFNTLIINIIERLKADKLISIKLISIGFFSSIVQSVMPVSFKFIFYLLSNVMYIGVIYMFFQPSGLKWWLLVLILFSMFVSSMQSTMFHSLLLWMAFFSFYFTIIKKYTFRTKLLIVVGGILILYIFQIVKWEIRKGFNAGGSVATFITIVDQKILSNSDLEETDAAIESFVVRLNQGWIISKIMDHIPKKVEFLNGETIWNAINSVFIPRFLMPSKAAVGGKEYFELFTGFALTDSTSMGASLLGEAYANFDKLGAILFMFGYGMFISFSIKLIYNFCKKYPTIILWLPLIFLQVVKAESDLIRVLNHLVKASLLVWGLYWFLGRVLKWKI